MELFELLKKRKALQLDLAAQISPRIAEFSRETGVSITRVGVNMVDLTTMSDPCPIHRVGTVVIDLEILNILDR